MTPDKQAAPSEWVERGMELADQYADAAPTGYALGDRLMLRAHLESREALVKQLAEALEAVLVQCGGYVPNTSKAAWAAAFAALAAQQQYVATQEKT